MMSRSDELRELSIAMTDVAKSGHPTTCMSCAEIMSSLFFQNTVNIHKDEFVLSKGHAAPILWAAMRLKGMIDDDLYSLRKMGSRLEGHPTTKCPWIKVCTGSLGQGLSVSLGMCITKKLEGSDGKVYTLMGDGEMAEGSVWEAIGLASKLNMTNLVGIVDCNGLGQNGCPLYDIDCLNRQISAFGWETRVIDGHDEDAVTKALTDSSSCPIMVLARTIKGKGYSDVEGKIGFHGKPLGTTDMNKLPFLTPPGNPISAPINTDTVPDFNLSSFSNADPSVQVATREAFGEALCEASGQYQKLLCVDADVGNSTMVNGFPRERLIQCYIAEQNMVGICMGISACGYLPVCATFAAFLSRAYDFVRMACVSKLKKLIVFGSHCGVSIGEDGSSQMALEDLGSFGALTGIGAVLYPCDAWSTTKCLETALKTEGPVYIRGTRQKTSQVYSSANFHGFALGNLHIVYKSADWDIRNKERNVVIFSAGITLHEALKAVRELETKFLRVTVVDVYCLRPLDKEKVMNVCKCAGRVITVEDHGETGGIGQTIASKIVGLPCSFSMLCVRDVPFSASPEELLEWAGIDCRSIIKEILTLEPFSETGSLTIEPKEKYVIYIDIDNTICFTNGNDYENSSPNTNAITNVNKIKQNGHRVVLWTARGGTRQDTDFFRMTMDQLQNWGVKFDELRMGKPSYDILIDDKTLTSLIDSRLDYLFQ
jgi:transketolase